MADPIKPITPKEIEDNLVDIFPEAVIQAFNELLKENYKVNGPTTFKLSDVESRIKLIDPKANIRKLIDKGKLDVEPLYRQHGWEVEYESPDRGESFEEYFSFEKKK
jgi:hypothetical protein